MQNPFETGHIKNYLLLYASVVVIMVLFFIASTLFHDIEEIDKMNFDSNVSVVSGKTGEFPHAREITEDENSSRKFKLLDKAY
ncbi:hypothetical protein KJ877_04240 [bacterium]|nr:hypothetical protein [bacterium]MBU1991017.1 hypothetical protein [bacterium]